MNVKLTCRLLKSIGCETVGVGDGFQMVERLKQERFDFALVDLHMPNCDGLTATRLYRQFETDNRPNDQMSSELINKPLVIIGLTGDQSVEIEDKCREAGMDGIIYKPFALESVKLKLQAFGVV
jgi:CheY-like chemotaxis protein